MDKRGLQKSTVLKLLKTYVIICNNFIYEQDYVIENTFILPRPYFCVVSMTFDLPYCDAPHMFNGVEDINPINLVNIVANAQNVQNLNNFQISSVGVPTE
jgi:hypothetical protein